MSLVLPLSEWPKQDRVMWADLTRQGGPFDDVGALAHLRDTSLLTLERRYARWLCWLTTHEPTAIALQPASRATLPRLSAWLDDLQHTKPMTQLMFVDGVLRILRAAAPEADWTAQLRLKASLKRAAGNGDRDRKAGRILSSDVLLRAGITMATKHANAAGTSLQSMKHLRDGTMIALLALMPMRRRAFASLRIGHSVLVADDEILIALPAELTKSGQPWEAVVPNQIDPLLRRYLTEARPMFMARGNQNHDILWVGERGTVFNSNYLGSRIAECTKKLTGVRVPPHFFRDAAATTLARLSPQSAKLIRPVLAHSGFGTAERHYIHAQTIEAGRDYATLVSKLKKGRR